jgi:transposase
LTNDGLFPFGHSNDHRPDLPQVKVMLATRDPVRMPVAGAVVAGQRADDPLYVPIITRVRASLGQTGLLYVGDCTLGTLANRAALQHASDHYLCPLGAVQLPAATLAERVDAALANRSVRIPIHRDAEDGSLPVIADGTEQEVSVTTMVDGQVVTWTERHLLVRSRAQAQAQTRALQQRLTQAQADLADLLVARRGKVRPTTPTALDAAVTAILTRYRVADILVVTTTATAQTRTLRPYTDRPVREVTTYDLALTTTIDPDAHAAAVDRLSWRMYVTNRPADQLSLEQAVLAYREEYLVEQRLGRLNGDPLSLSPVYLSRDDHTTGLIRLLMIGVRVLAGLATAIRTQMSRVHERVTGLYAGQPQRATARPTAEQVLAAFRNMTLTVMHLPGQVIRHLTPLSVLQQRLITLAGLDAAVSTRLTEHSFKPPG